MKIFSWNVNGIRAVLKKGALQSFLDTHDPDILCIQETKAERGQVDVDFEHYEEHWHSAERKGYSGTAIFTKRAPENVLYGFPDEIQSAHHLADTYGDTTKEGRVLTLEFEGFFVSTVYTPNAKDDLSRIPMRRQWDPSYREYVELLQKQKPVICCGDFNVAHTEDDLARPKENVGNKGFTEEERNGFESLLATGLIDTFRSTHEGNGFYTWWSHWGQARERNVGWRIDYVLMSESLTPIMKKADIHADVLGSDHCPVSVELGIEF
ncbi:exodeoxyribonuclease III [Candidatus Kaiserbacteria bacterium]|nr:exodeoxyribonuclease III [Candidatus Kaiserbacteria bacterium]